MAADGYGLIQYGQLVDWVDGDGAKGVNLLMGEVDADVLELDLPELGKVALRIVGAKSQVEPVVQDGRVTGLTVTCRVDANLAEGAGEVNLAREEIRRQLNFTSLRFNRLDDMIEATGLDKSRLCTYCWDGQE